MDYALMFPGRFLKAAEFKGKDVTLVIAGVRIEELPEEKGGTKAKGIMAFAGTKKELVLNRTNAECIKTLFGRETDAWIGKRVTFYPANIDSFGEADIAIRVRGSPDIARAITFDLHLARKKPRTMTLQRTGQKSAAKTNGAAAKVELPPPEDTTMEPGQEPSSMQPEDDEWGLRAEADAQSSGEEG